MVLGTGLRNTGNFAGARMQNGFHRLIGSDIETMKYVATDRTDATLWIAADRYRWLRYATSSGFFGGWRTGYWVRGSMLLTSDGQADSSVGAYAVTSKNTIDLWLGLRRDWRNGYDRDIVQMATADAESDVGVVLGVRFGAFMLETVQQPGGDASYGQLKFASTGKTPFPGSTGWPRTAFEFGFLLPDVQVKLASRFRSNILVPPDSTWHQSVLLEARYGEPQLGDDTSVFVRSRQLTVGLEMEHILSPAANWISYYGSLAAGYRSEQLQGDNVLAGQTSAAVDKAVINAETGLRFNAAALGSAWTYRLQLGLAAGYHSAMRKFRWRGTITIFTNLRLPSHSV